MTLAEMEACAGKLLPLPAVPMVLVIVLGVAIDAVLVAFIVRLLS